MLLSPEKALFVRGGTPVLLLSDAALHDDLPVVSAPDGALPRVEGWSIVPKLTLCVVDGPGEAGLVIPSLTAVVIDVADGAPAPGNMGEWCADAERAGGAIVLSLDELPEVLDWSHLLGSGTTRGAFMTSPR